jgi:20S proteasome alpha/beta subunit
MTLVAAFRARQGGVLLCADRKEEEGYTQREIDKIYYIQELHAFQVFIAGAGPTTIIKKANEYIHKALLNAESDRKTDILTHHCACIESSLKAIYSEYKEELDELPMGLIIVVAPRVSGSAPIFYKTDKSVLSIEPLYCAHGSGRIISDYLQDRLYRHGMHNNALALLAAFIFREAERKASGVGLGTDMVFINEGGQASRCELGWDTVTQLQADIPPLMNAIYPCWERDAKTLDWLKKKEFCTLHNLRQVVY